MATSLFSGARAFSPDTPALTWSPFTRQSVAIIGGSWATVALLSAATTAATPLRNGTHPAFLSSLVEAATTCAAMAFISPLPLLSVQRWPLSARRSWAMHAAAFVAFLMLSTGLTGVLRVIAGDGVGPTDQLLIRSVFGAIVAYAVVALIGHWVTTAARLRFEAARRVQMAAQLTEARLEALGAQLRPHFLFNALNTVSALIHEQPHAADKLVVQLGNLLRTTLARSGSTSIPLREELEFVRLYVEVMKARVGERLTVEWNVDSRAEHGLVPQLILLPLVENALQHGIIPAHEPACLLVAVRLVAPTIEIEVSDTGLGVDLDSLVENVGLSTTRQRLRLLYGEDTLAIRPRRGGGTIVSLHVPA